MKLSLRKPKHGKFELEGDDIKKSLHKNLEFTAIEQYKLIRTNLDFTLPENEKCPVIGVTSSTRGEGKSTTSINLSYVLALKGSKVLLIDGDLRLPSIAKKLDIDNNFGLANFLTREGAQVSQISSFELDNWYVLTSGDIPPNPSELLGSSRMKKALEQFKEAFDYIVIDLPPVNVVSDPVSVSGLLSGMVLVVREERTGKKEMDKCVRQLKLSNVNVLGCVMTYANSGMGSYGKYKKYKYYKYYKYYKDYKSEPND